MTSCNTHTRCYHIAVIFTVFVLVSYSFASAKKIEKEQTQDKNKQEAQNKDTFTPVVNVANNLPTSATTTPLISTPNGVFSARRDVLDSMESNIQRHLYPQTNSIVEILQILQTKQASFPDLSITHKMEPITQGLSPGFYLVQQGKLLFSASQDNVRDAPDLRLILLPDGRMLGEVAQNPAAAIKEDFNLYVARQLNGFWINSNANQQAELRWDMPYRKDVYACAVNEVEYDPVTRQMRIKGLMKTRKADGTTNTAAFRFVVTRIAFDQLQLLQFYRATPTSSLLINTQPNLNTLLSPSFAPNPFQPAFPQPLLGNGLLAQPLVGQSLVGQPLVGQSLVGQSLVGQSLVGQPLYGRSLVNQPLYGQSLTNIGSLPLGTSNQNTLASATIPSTNMAINNNLNTIPDARDPNTAATLVQNAINNPFAKPITGDKNTLVNANAAAGFVNPVDINDPRNAAIAGVNVAGQGAIADSLATRINYQNLGAEIASAEGVLVEGEYMFRGTSRSGQTAQMADSATIIVTLEKGGRLTGTAQYPSVNGIPGGSRPIVGIWTPLLIRYQEEANGFVYTFQGGVDLGRKTISGLYTFVDQSRERTGVFVYQVNPLKLTGSIKGGMLRPGQYEWTGVTANAATPNDVRSSPLVKVSLYEDGKLRGFAEYPATTVTAPLVRELTGTWTKSSIWYQETVGGLVYTFQGVMVEPERMTGIYAFASVKPDPKNNAESALPYIWRGTFRYNLKSSAPLAQSFLMETVLVEGEYLLSGSTTNPHTGSTKQSPDIKVTLAAAGKLTGYVQYPQGARMITGSWTPATIRYHDQFDNVIYTFFGVLQDGKSRIVGMYRHQSTIGGVEQTGTFTYNLKPITVRARPELGSLAIGQWVFKGKTVNAETKATKDTPQLTVTLDADGTLTGYAEYPSASNNAPPSIRALRGNWTSSGLNFQEQHAYRTYFYHGIMVARGRLMGAYAFDPTVDTNTGVRILPQLVIPADRFYHGTFDLQGNFIGPGPLSHPSEPKDVFVEGEYVLFGTNTDTTTKTSKPSALIKIDLVKGNKLVGFAQYPLQSSWIEGTWTPTSISYIEKSGTVYEFFGKTVRDKSVVTGTFRYQAGETMLPGTFEYKVTALRLRGRAVSGMLFPGQYVSTGTTMNIQTRANAAAPKITYYLNEDGKLNGMAEYGATPPATAPTVRRIEGTWTINSITYTERANNDVYTFEGRVSQQGKLSGTYSIDIAPGNQPRDALGNVQDLGTQLRGVFNYDLSPVPGTLRPMSGPASVANNMNPLITGAFQSGVNPTVATVGMGVGGVGGVGFNTLNNGLLTSNTINGVVNTNTLNTLNTLNTINTVNTMGTVNTVNTLNTLNNIQTINTLSTLHPNGAISAINALNPNPTTVFSNTRLVNGVLQPLNTVSSNPLQPNTLVNAIANNAAANTLNALNTFNTGAVNNVNPLANNIFNTNSNNMMVNNMYNTGHTSTNTLVGTTTTSAILPPLNNNSPIQPPLPIARFP